MAKFAVDIEVNGKPLTVDVDAPDEKQATAYVAQMNPVELEKMSAPPQGFLERNAGAISGMARPALEMGGMMAGGALAAGAAAPTVAGAIPAGAAGGALGYAAGKSAADLLDRSLGLKTPVAGAAAAARETGENILHGAAAEAGGQIAGKAVTGTLKAAAKVIPPKIPRVLGQFVGIPERVTEYVQKRGSANVFTPANLAEDAAAANVGAASTGVAARKSAKGAAMRVAEDARIDRVGNVTPPIRHVREGIEDALARRGFTGKEGILARDPDVKLLQDFKLVLTPTPVSVAPESGLGVTRETVGEKLTLRQAINAKRFIDDHIDFEGLSKTTQTILKRANGQLRAAVRKDLGAEVANLWDEFGTIARAQQKLAKYTGKTGPDGVVISDFGEDQAARKIQQLMVRRPGKVDALVRVLGEGLPGGEAQARQIVDSVAAQAFTKPPKGAPSNIILKGLSTLGAISGPASRAAVRGGEALQRAALRPAPGSSLLGAQTTSAAMAALRARREQK